MTVNVFDDHGGFVNKNANRKSQSSKGHDIDGLPRAPERHNRGEKSERNGDDHNERTAPVAEKQQHHQAGQDGAKDSLLYNGLQRVPDIRGLVEDVVDLDVGGHDGLEISKVVFDFVDDTEGGGIGALGDRDIDGAAAIHLSVSSKDVAGIFDGANI